MSVMQKTILLERSNRPTCAAERKRFFRISKMANATFTTYGADTGRPSIRNIFARVRDWNEARRTREALSKLSAHELEDIGIMRGDIDRIANRRY